MAKSAGILWGVLASAGILSAQVVTAMPPWMEAFPGAVVTRSAGSLDESYRVDAAPAEVAAHYRKLFDAQRLPFRPRKSGDVDVVVAAVPGCNLRLELRPEGDGTSVQATCADRLESVEPHEDGAHRPKLPAAAPAFSWPDWLVAAGNNKLTPRKGVDQAGREVLKAACDVAGHIVDLREFYSKLMRSHGYRVTSETHYYEWPVPVTIVDGAGTSLAPAIHIELKPLDGGSHLEMRVTAPPKSARATE